MRRFVRFSFTSLYNLPMSLPCPECLTNDSPAFVSKKLDFCRKATLLSLLLALLLVAGCGSIVKQKVNVPSLLTPLSEADQETLYTHINNLAEVQSLRGKVDIQFLDTSFAQCGVNEKYRTADGQVIVQRPGNVFLEIQVPFVGTSIAQMSSDGSRFRAAVLMGEERYKRFVTGSNNANYPKIKNGNAADCGNEDKAKSVDQRRAVSAISGLRPQHFVDALLIRPIEPQNGFLYVMSESFEEEPDTRSGAKKGARVVRGYYVLDELSPLTSSRGRLLRRFWLDRHNQIRLARLQTFDEKGSLTTDVRYGNPQKFGSGQMVLPAFVELTRPQDHYSLRITYQSPSDVAINREYQNEVFVLQNRWHLPEVDLDKRHAEIAQ
jgi:hypothetical protein